MADLRRENFMSIEHAIQIELAYRRKIVMLNMETNNDTGQELMSLQVHLSSPSGNPSSISNSNPSLSRVKQLAPPSNQELPSGNASSRPGLKQITCSVKSVKCHVQVSLTISSR
ncbi:hypothetical protein SLA2020_003910 [Shorea laevis]